MISFKVKKLVIQFDEPKYFWILDDSGKTLAESVKTFSTKEECVLEVKAIKRQISRYTKVLIET